MASVMMLALMFLAVAAPAMAQSRSNCLLDVVVLFDRSGSICNNNRSNSNCINLQRQKDFTNTLASDFFSESNNIRVALFTFSDGVVPDASSNTFATSAAEISSALDNVISDGRTVTREAIQSAQTFLAANGRVDATDVIVLITDGTPNDGGDRAVYAQQTIDQAGLAMGAGITMIVVGVRGSDFDEGIIRQLASGRGNNAAELGTDYYIAEDFTGLDQTIVANVIERSCRVDCRVTNVDVYMAIDGSGSIDLNDFNRMLTFTKEVINDLPLGPASVQIAASIFSDGNSQIFDLNDFTANDLMAAALDGVTFSRGRTNMGAAIRGGRSELTSSRGRAGAAKILVILSDGAPNNREDTLLAAKEAKADGIHIFTIRVGTWVDQYDMYAISSYTWQRNAYLLTQFSDLNTNFRRTLVDVVCQNTRFCASDPCEPDEICVDIVNGHVCESQAACPSDIVFAVDQSGSIGNGNFRTQLDFLQNIITKINVKTNNARIGMVLYGDTASNNFFLNDHTSGEVVYQLNALQALYPVAAKTNLSDALRVMRTEQFTAGRGDRSEALNVGFVITDGVALDSAQLMAQAENAHNAGITTLVASIGDMRNVIELDAMSSYPNAPIQIQSYNMDDLDASVDNIVTLLCNGVNECQPGDFCQNGGAATNAIGGCLCRCETGYSGRQCERGCGNQYDIVLVVDTSGSIRNERFPIVQDFLKALVMNFEVGSDRARFGAITFSSTARMAFNMNRYTAMTELLVGIDRLSYEGGDTNLADGLSLAQSMFTSNNGDRVGVTNYVIVISDGKSTVNTANTIPNAINLRINAAAKVIVVGIGSDADSMELTNVASDPVGSMMIMQPSMTVIQQNVVRRNGLINQVVDATCDKVDECSPNPCVNGECQNDLHKFYCSCPVNFAGPTCAISCTTSNDVTLILDLSGSAQPYLMMIRQIARTIVDHLEVGNNARVAAVRFSDVVARMYDLNRYLTKKSAMGAISFSEMNQGTNTAAALDFTRLDMLTNSRGDRSFAPNTVILISGGRSTINAENTISAATNLKINNARLYVIMVGEDNNDMRSEAEAMSSTPPSDYVKEIKTDTDIIPVVSTIITDIC